MIQFPISESSESSEIALAVRDLKLYVHCPRIQLIQTQKENGYDLRGHGVLKTSSHGVIYLEFVCTSPAELPNFRYQTPRNPLDHENLFTVFGETLDGINFLSASIVLPSRSLSSTDIGAYYHIPLDEVAVKSSFQTTKAGFAVRTVIFLGNIDVIGSLCGDQTSYTSGDYSVKINSDNPDTRIVRVTVAGPVENIGTAMDAALFFVGFTTGQCPQPYFEETLSPDGTQTRLLSRDEAIAASRISRPTYAVVGTPDGKITNFEPHLQLAASILELSLLNPDKYLCLSRSWQMVYHSMQSSVFNMVSLVVGISIEAILNQFYPEILKASLLDADQDKLRELTLSWLKQCKTIPPGAKDRLVTHVSTWGKLYAKKMLLKLATEGLLTDPEVKSWEHMRNSQAHPRFVKTIDENETLLQQRREVIVCLGVFYKLILFALRFDGAIYNFSADEHEFIMMPEVQNICPVGSVK